MTPIRMKTTTLAVRQWRHWSFIKILWAADAISRLPRKVTLLSNTEQAFNDDIPTDCIVCQVCGIVKVCNAGTESKGSLPTKKMWAAKAAVALCQNFRKLIKKNGLVVVKNTKLVHKKALTDELVQINFPTRHQRVLLYYELFPTSARCPGSRTALWKLNYWSRVVSDVYDNVIKCESRRKHRPSQKHWK